MDTPGLKGAVDNALRGQEGTPAYFALLKRLELRSRVKDVARYAVRLAAASRPGEAKTPTFINDWVNWGAGLRAGQYLVLGAKARAVLNGRSHVTIDDIKAVAHPVMRHRILVNYRAEADGISVEKVISRLIEEVPEPS